MVLDFAWKLFLRIFLSTLADGNSKQEIVVVRISGKSIKKTMVFEQQLEY